MDFLPLDFLPFSYPDDTVRFHQWVSQPYAKFWNLLGASLEEVHQNYQKTWAEWQAVSYWGQMGNDIVCYIEVYDPLNTPLKHHLPFNESDRGFHFLLAPVSQNKKTGFSRFVFKECLAFLFNQLNVSRIVVEPDIQNKKIHAMNEQFGFTHLKTCWVDSKCCKLSVCQQTHFQEAENRFMRL